MSGAPWTSFALEDPQVSRWAPTARSSSTASSPSATAATYSALVSSAYVRRDGGWRLAFHQQTPR